jgi:hypothetical protein
MEDSKKSADRTVGLDLGDRQGHYCILDAHGEKLEEGSLAAWRIHFDKGTQGDLGDLPIQNIALRKARQDKDLKRGFT